MLKEFIQQHKRILAEIILVLTICILGYFTYLHFKAVPLAIIADTSPISIAQGQKKIGVYENEQDAKQVSNLIQERVKKAPDTVFYTATQKEADVKVNQIAKKEKADYVLKETTKEENKNNTEQITNKYYGVTQEKKNQIVAGITATDKNVYATIGFQKDKVEALVHTKDFKTIQGATFLYSVKKW